MKRHLYTLAILALTFSANAQKTNPAPYCASSFNNNYNMMSNISIGAYTHSFGALGSTADPNTYLYVDTATFPNISKDYEITMFLDMFSVADTEPIYFGVWIDYNQNNTFDSSELIAYNHQALKAALPSGSASDVSIPIKIKAPASAFPGKTRMRVTRRDGPMSYDSTFLPSPCATAAASGDTYGNTYDFDVNIIGLPSAIEELALKNQLMIVPNPASNIIEIKNSSTAKIKTVSILDMAGKTIFISQNQEPINISNLANGMYWASILLDNGKQEMRSFVKK